MIIVCCGMYRSGSTLQYQIASALAGTTGQARIMGFGLGRVSETAREKPRPIFVVKDHHYSERAREYSSSPHAKFVYGYRDVRDVVVSMMQTQHMTFDTFRHHGRGPAGFVGYLLNTFERWTNLPGVLVSRYEEIVADVPREVRKIADHTGIHIPYTECHRIAEQLSVDKQREFISGFDFAKDGAGQAVNRMDEKSQLHEYHLNGGESGKWRTHLTPDQIAVVNDAAKDWLKQQGYPV